MPALLVAALSATTACGPPDVEERLHLRVAGDGTSQVTFEIRFPEQAAEGGRDQELGESETARRQRIEALRQLYFEGWDPWAERFEEAGRAGETLHWERVGGKLRSLTRTALLETPEALADFFADTDLTVVLTPGPGEAELAIYPGPSSRASRDERRRLKELLDRWSRAAADYLREVADLYAYLDSRPESAEPIFQTLFDNDSEIPLAPSEEERLERLLEDLFKVLEIAAETDDQGLRLELLTRRVYDPFPARLQVKVDGPLIARQGFVELGDGGYEIPPLGLEHALGNLEAVWIQPPLLTTYEKLERLGDSVAFDAAEFARRPRRVAELPDAGEITEAVEEALTPAAEYRLQWRPGDG